MNKLIGQMAFIALMSTVWIGSAGAATREYQYQIVGKDTCQVMGRYLTRCSAPEQLVPLETSILVDYKVHVDISVGDHCRTSFPIYLAYTLGESSTSKINIFNQRFAVIDQEGRQSISYGSSSPYSNVAYYDSRCEINATVSVDNYTIEEVIGAARSRVEAIRGEQTTIEDRINDKSIIREMYSVISLYESLWETANTTDLSVSSLNDILQASCVDQDVCTWSDQLGVLLYDPNIEIPDNQYLLLLNLSFQLDAIVADGCSSEGCVNDLIDQETEEAIAALKERIVLEQLDSEIETLITRLVELDSELLELESTVTSMGIDWAEVY